MGKWTHDQPDLNSVLWVVLGGQSLDYVISYACELG